MQLRKFAFALVMTAALAGAAQNHKNYRLPTEGGNPQYHDYTTYTKGFWIAAEASGGIYCDFGMDKVSAPLEITVTPGYRFSEFLKLGVGVGARYYINNDYVRARSIKWSFPLYLNVRGNIIASAYREVVPYYSLDLGGAIRDGFMWRPTIGLRIGQDRSAFLVGLSYLGQSLKGWDKHSESGINDHKYASFVMVRLGYEL